MFIIIKEWEIFVYAELNIIESAMFCIFYTLCYIMSARNVITLPNSEYLKLRMITFLSA